jgi:hypothetical protein
VIRARASVPFVACALLLTAGARAASTDAAASPRAVVKALYAHHFAHDMAFTESSVRSKEAWLAPDFMKVCLAYLAQPGDPNEAPLIDGDPFTDSQEYPRRFKVGEPERPKPSTARVPVSLKRPHLAKRVVVILTLVQDEWKVSDVQGQDGTSLVSLLGTAAKPGGSS